MRSIDLVDVTSGFRTSHSEPLVREWLKGTSERPSPVQIALLYFRKDNHQRKEY